MRRRLPAALAAVALAAAALLLAGCSGDDSAEAVATTGAVATTTTDPGRAGSDARDARSSSTPSRREPSSSTTTTTGRAGTSRTRSIRTSLPTPPNANSAKKGARAGDNALFNFKLYSDLDLTRADRQRDLLLHVQLRPGSDLRGQLQPQRRNHDRDGPGDTHGSDIILPVTGGTGRYAGAHGQLTSRASGNKKNTQIIRFRLL